MWKAAGVLMVLAAIFHLAADAPKLLLAFVGWGVWSMLPGMEAPK
jgi:hypothetical protein